VEIVVPAIRRHLPANGRFQSAHFYICVATNGRSSTAAILTKTCKCKTAVSQILSRYIRYPPTAVTQPPPSSPIPATANGRFPKFYHVTYAIHQRPFRNRRRPHQNLQMQTAVFQIFITLHALSTNGRFQSVHF
jgi:hypothetical protein